jgi:hypothetical protein
LLVAFNKENNTRKINLLTAAALLVALSRPAFAATAQGASDASAMTASSQSEPFHYHGGPKSND